MRWFLPLALALFACKPTDDTDTSADADTDADSDSDTDADSDADSDADTDSDTDADADSEARVRDLIDNGGDVGEVLTDVALADGWPLHTSADTWLFVVPYDGAWSLVGDAVGWDPGLPMTAAEGFSWIEVSLDDPLGGSKYKFRAGTDYVGDPFARYHTHDEFGDISYVAPPQGTWWLERWPGIGGHGMAAREVNVLVPGTAGPHPVLYMHDGQNLFAWDPEGIPAQGWFVQDAVAALADPVIVVGIDNTFDRLDEYAQADEDLGSFTITARGDDYADYVALDVKPFVEERYASLVSDRAGVLGSSMGGLVSLWIGHRHPEEFDFVGAMSPSLFVGAVDSPGPTMEAVWLADTVHAGQTVYVDSGGDDGGDGCTDPDGDGYPEDDPNASDNFCESRQFVDALAGHGYVWDDTLYHWHEPGAQHTEAAWADRLFRPLAIFSP